MEQEIYQLLKFRGVDVSLTDLDMHIRLWEILQNFKNDTKDIKLSKEDIELKFMPRSN